MESNKKIMFNSCYLESDRVYLNPTLNMTACGMGRRWQRDGKVDSCPYEATASQTQIQPHIKIQISTRALPVEGAVQEFRPVQIAKIVHVMDNYHKQDEYEHIL